MSFDKKALAQNLGSVLQRITTAYSQANTSVQSADGDPLPSEFRPSRNIPCLLAVSKTFPAEAVAACYAEGQRHFGENYLHELQDKAPVLADSCPDIRWHYIGKIQSNKIRKICEIPGLWCVQTLESKKHADLLQKSCAELAISCLNVFIQVNTSGEPNKGGIRLNANGHGSDSSDNNEDALESLAIHITARCPNLKLLGLMTIGSFAESSQSAKGRVNRDFSALVTARKRVCEALNISDASDLELSMGMSHDFETAIYYGATTVRVGSLIFGERNYAKNE